MDAKVGLTLSAVNKGGEIHTFTKVAKFGGGVVPEINALLHLTPSAGVRSRRPTSCSLAVRIRTTSFESGTTLYQCCIHPWMQTVVHGKG